MKNDEPDAATVERCAQIADRATERNESLRKKYANTCDSAYYLWCSQEAKSIASAIRSLIPNSAKEIHSSDGLGLVQQEAGTAREAPRSTTGCLQHPNTQVDARPSETTSMREALEAAVRCAKLALFVIRKQGVMPNSSWENGFNKDLAKAEAALSSPAPDRLSDHEKFQIRVARGRVNCGELLTNAMGVALLAIITRLSRQPEEGNECACGKFGDGEICPAPDGTPLCAITDQPDAERLALAEDDHLKRCTICGFVIDVSYKAEKPTADFTTRGRTKTKSAEEDEEETYQIGVRDGYESAIQDLDIATGGDGEFKGSTLPGGTVDVPAMKARIIERFQDLRAGGWREDMENAPRCVEHEERGIYKSDDGSLFYFKPTHWRPSAPHTDKND